MTSNSANSPEIHVSLPWNLWLRNFAYIAAALLMFLFSLDLMISSVQQIGRGAAETIILATSNPFIGLIIGLLITAIIQSSSATTSMAVVLVASGSLTIEGAIPIIMGANVGTTITATIVSLGFITKKKEFQRAMSAGTYHFFFNVLTVILLFPLEYYYGFLSGLSKYIATRFFNEPIGPIKSDFSLLGNGFSPLVDFLLDTVNNSFLLTALSFAMLYSSILLFRKVLTKILGFTSQPIILRLFFKNAIKSFAWGLFTTAAIRSSTVTTSLVVPLVANKLVKLKAAVPFILGANIGTTITAFIAASFNSNAAISIALAHFLFNFIGVIVFFSIPYAKEVPIYLADKLGRLTLKYRLAGFLFLLVTFFFVPFCLIYFHKNAVKTSELAYQITDFATNKKSAYSVIVKTYENQQLSRWYFYDIQKFLNQGNETKVVSVARKDNLLFFDTELYELNKQGFCKDGEDKNGKFKVCIEQILETFTVTPVLIVDSVYVFRKDYYIMPADSSFTKTYISAASNKLVRKQKMTPSGKILWLEELISEKK
jgi:solute carrier family 34 (sodium-dependent phosphate cotransporter)